MQKKMLLFMCCISASLFSQSSVFIGGGYEMNSIGKKFDELTENGEFVTLGDSPFTTWTLRAIVQKEITLQSSLSLSAIFSQNRHKGVLLGGIAPKEDFGFRRISLRPSYVYSRGNWLAGVGGDISILFNHFHGIRDVKRNSGSARRPELFNVQFGLSSFIGYEWKRFMIQTDMSVGLFYRERYNNYIDVFNTYGLSLFYILLDKRG
jgi:hypothetical protein